MDRQRKTPVRASGGRSDGTGVWPFQHAVAPLSARARSPRSPGAGWRVTPGLLAVDADRLRPVVGQGRRSQPATNAAPQALPGQAGWAGQIQAPRPCCGPVGSPDQPAFASAAPEPPPDRTPPRGDGAAAPARTNAAGSASAADCARPMHAGSTCRHAAAKVRDGRNASAACKPTPRFTRRSGVVFLCLCLAVVLPGPVVEGEGSRKAGEARPAGGGGQGGRPGRASKKAGKAPSIPATCCRSAPRRGSFGNSTPAGGALC